jgi:Ankyrin repeats (many copies)
LEVLKVLIECVGGGEGGVGNGYLEIVELLMECGASVDMPNLGGVTPLFNAAITGYLEIVRVLN